MVVKERESRDVVDKVDGVGVTLWGEEVAVLLLLLLLWLLLLMLLLLLDCSRLGATLRAGLKAVSKVLFVDVYEGDLGNVSDWC